ncbi:MAG: hypothetical protein MJ065_09595 [Oscillospiraceae bacterium]|nr:hypothetical protein [Oscillospiraceae bacterium]
MNMIDKAAVTVLAAYYTMKAKVQKLMSDEDGMETVQAVILIVVAVAVALVLLEILTKGGDSDHGLIGDLVEKIKEKLMGALD